MELSNDTPAPTKPLMAGCQQEPCSPSLPDRLRLTAYAKRSDVEAIHNEAADRIEVLERTLADYIDKSEKLVYGAHGNAYLPGQMRTWLRATHNGKIVAANSPENDRPLAPADTQTPDANGNA